MVRIKRMVNVAAIAVSAMAPTVVPAQQLSDQWQFRASIYGWLPDIGGNTTFPAGTGSSINVNADKIIDSLKFTFMGTFEAQKGRWGAFTDVIYLDVGGSKSGTRDLTIGHVTLPAGISADASLDIKAWVWTLAGTYRVVADPGATLDVLAGARLLDIEEKLNWQFSADIVGVAPPPRTGSNELKDNVLGWDHRRQRTARFRRQSRMVCAVLRRCGYRRFRSDVAGHCRTRLRVPLGRNIRRLAVYGLQLQVGFENRRRELQRSGDRCRISVVAQACIPFRSTLPQVTQ